MKKGYTKPTVMSEGVFEVLAAGCTLEDPTQDANCDPDWGYTTNHIMGSSVGALG